MEKDEGVSKQFVEGKRGLKLVLKKRGKKSVVGDWGKKKRGPPTGPPGRNRHYRAKKKERDFRPRPGGRKSGVPPETQGEGGKEKGLSRGGEEKRLSTPTSSTWKGGGGPCPRFASLVTKEEGRPAFSFPNGRGGGKSTNVRGGELLFPSRNGAHLPTRERRL